MYIAVFEQKVIKGFAILGEYRNPFLSLQPISIRIFLNFMFLLFSGGIKPLPKKATRNVTMAALLIEEVTRQLAKE